MVFILALYTLFSNASPRCVEIFDITVKTTTQDEFIKNYLALNMAFPQHRSTISLGVTAFYFSKRMAFELVYKNLTPKQWDLVYTSMIRAHAANGVTLPVSLKDAEFVLATFTMTMPYRISRTQAWLESHFGNKDSAESVARLQRYSETILLTLRSPEARELSLRFREALRPAGSQSPTQRFTREQISDEIRDLVIQKLQIAHPELSDALARTLYESMI